MSEEQTHKLETLFDDIMNITKEYEVMGAIPLGLKIQEEVGEYSEALLVESGFLAHKREKIEGSFGEAADVIITLIGSLVKAHPEMSANEVRVKLTESIARKQQKYINVLGNVDMDYVEYLREGRL